MANDHEIVLNVAKLAREIAMDVLPVQDLLTLNHISDEEWCRIQDDPKFQVMLKDMVLEWNSASNTRQRIKIKAQTAIEVLMDTLFREVIKGEAPLTQKVDAVRQLARLGELEGAQVGGGQAGDRVSIVINMGAPQAPAEPITIDVTPNQSVDG